MDEAIPAELAATVVEALRHAGAVFAFVHGSRASGTARPDSDRDIAAWWPAQPPAALEADPLSIREVKHTFVTAIESCVDV